jgi:hypothetical protein
MKRDYTSGVKENITYFTGIEIEQTPAFGMMTLFVVGVQRSEEIITLAKEKECKHIYFGANQSFPKIDINDARVWKQWEVMIKACLDADYWCTLDLDVACAEGLLESSLVEHRRFIPQLSVKLPYLTQLGYNATIKIDDKDFDATNPGVWCHRLRDLTTTNSFTDWDEYGKDIVIK